VSIRLNVTVPLEDENKEFDYVFQQAEITLGRHSRNDIRIPTPEVSSEHARIHVEGDEWTIVDLDSQCGTTLDGEPVPPNEPTAFTEDSVIGVGGCTIRVTADAEEVTHEVEEKTQQVGIQMVREVLGAIAGGGAAPYLEVLNDDEQGTRAELNDEGSEVVLGREHDCELRLGHWSVSRRHARVRRDREGVTVEDMGSKNGVMVNETVIDGSQRLVDGDVIFVGHTQIRFHDPSDSLIDQLDDIPTPVNIDIKTTIIEVESRKKDTTPPKAEPDSTPPAAKVEAEEKAKPEKKPKPSPAEAPAPTGEPAPAAFDDDLSGGLGDWLFPIVGIVVILAAIAAVLFLFVL
jgi:pSer/pThr/pTyr-binding forkhead associated (FHA) protein